MKFKVKDYRINKQILESSLRRSPDKNPIDVVSSTAAYSHCPLLALFIFLGEIQGMTPELQKRIDDTIKFYGITEVINEN